MRKNEREKRDGRGKWAGRGQGEKEEDVGER
jgi:hypothetical protein